MNLVSAGQKSKIVSSVDQMKLIVWLVDQHNNIDKLATRTGLGVLLAF